MKIERTWNRFYSGKQSHFQTQDETATLSSFNLPLDQMSGHQKLNLAFPLKKFFKNLLLVVVWPSKAIVLGIYYKTFYTRN